MSNYLGARIRVAFVESDVIFRTGLRALLEPRNDFEWVGESASLSDFRARYTGVGIQVIMIDAELLQELDKCISTFGCLLGPMPSFCYSFPISSRRSFHFISSGVFMVWSINGTCKRRLSPRLDKFFFSSLTCTPIPSGCSMLSAIPSEP